jgi:hypothetical protein
MADAVILFSSTNEKLDLSNYIQGVSDVINNLLCLLDDDPFALSIRPNFSARTCTKPRPSPRLEIWLLSIFQSAVHLRSSAAEKKAYQTVVAPE